MKVRSFYVKCSGEECEDILSYLLENVKARDISYRVTPSGIYVTIRGLEPEIRDAWQRIRYYSSLAKRLRSGRGVVEIPVNHIAKETGVTVSAQALVEALRLKGYKAEFAEGLIRSDAPREELLGLARVLGEVAKSLGMVVRGSAARRLVSVAVALTGTRAEDVLEVAGRLGLMVYDEDSGRYVLTREWRDALRLLLRALRRGEAGSSV